MKSPVNETRLQLENVTHAGTGGVSRGNASLGFRPAFLDSATFAVYPSRFANGSPAPFHLLDGLPDEIIGRIKHLPFTRLSRPFAGPSVADQPAAVPCTGRAGRIQGVGNERGTASAFSAATAAARARRPARLPRRVLR